MLEINKKAFYDAIRPRLFNGVISKAQLAGMETIIDYYAKRYTDKKWLAYLLATTYHETAKTMQPIEEYGKGKNYDYGKKLKMSRQPYTFPDKLYYGRGFVQLTWYENYQQFSKLLSLDLLGQPELAQQPLTAAKILVEGSVRGLFTGRKLADYFIGVKEDPRQARRIINGMDKADLIAGYYNAFKDALHPSLLTV